MTTEDHSCSSVSKLGHTMYIFPSSIPKEVQNTIFLQTKQQEDTSKCTVQWWESKSLLCEQPTVFYSSLWHWNPTNNQQVNNIVHFRLYTAECYAYHLAVWSVNKLQSFLAFPDTFPDFRLESSMVIRPPVFLFKAKQLPSTLHVINFIMADTLVMPPVCSELVY